MAIHVSGVSGLAVTLAVLFLPAILVAYFLHSAVWLIAIPLGIVTLALLVAALPIKRKVSPRQYADELESHLLGNEGPWDWDDTTSIAIADDRLERLRQGLSKFDSLRSQEDRAELRMIIDALRNGEFPKVKLAVGEKPREHGFIRLHLND